MPLTKHSRNHHEDTRASFSETRKRSRVGRNNGGQPVSDAKPGGSGVERVLREETRIRGIDVLRAVQVHSTGPLGTEAEFPRARNFALDGDICLVRVAVLEIFGQGKCEWQDGKRKTCLQVCLIGKERTSGKRVETLVARAPERTWGIAERERRGKLEVNRIGIEDTLKNGETV